MPLWESNEIYFFAGFTVLVTLGVFASVAYFVYKKVATNGRRANEEQAALEKVLLRKETITSSPPTKPLIVSPSFSSPNKVPARHLRSGSYSPTHYLSPYHIRQPRRNSSPTSNISSIQQPKLPQLQLQHPQEQDTDTLTTTAETLGAETASDVAPSPGNELNIETSVPVIKTNSNNKQQQSQQPLNGGRNNVPGSLAHHNSQYYGTISPRRVVGRHTVAPAENNPLVSNANSTNNSAAAFLPLKSGNIIGTGPVIVSNLKSSAFIKSEYVQLPGKDGVDCNEGWKNKDECFAATEKWKNCSDMDDGAALRKKLLLQKQYQHKLQLQQQQNRMSNEPPGELFKMKHTVSEEIPYYISTQ